METSCMSGGCPLQYIHWGWYVVSVVVVYALGAVWYGKLFTKQWLKALKYKCECGAKLYKNEKCTCKKRSFLPMIIQFVATMVVGLMYFVLVPYSIWLALLVSVAVSGWMKASLKFKIPKWKRFVWLAAIEVGYFFLASLIFIGFALIK